MQEPASAQSIVKLSSFQHCHGNRVFLTSSVLAAKPTPGVSDKDQIHRFSGSPQRAGPLGGRSITANGYLREENEYST